MSVAASKGPTSVKAVATTVVSDSNPKYRNRLSSTSPPAWRTIVVTANLSRCSASTTRNGLASSMVNSDTVWPTNNRSD